ncbi:class I SAM-dependent methyltransferase [Limnohabitans sp. DM1]|uniref:class I SAM-dependent methyltransferase n=1 Tax=Limnohabitans sp. DM1 TaxID=1597955 RepID=UPI000AB1A1FF|nr:class I SAM-dependent methyltransferase [Limnohabitans sp. DM1]
MQFQTDFPIVDALQGVPRTSLVPLVARARAGASYPALDPQDRYAQDLLTAMGVQVHTGAEDTAALVNVLWRTSRIKQLGLAFFARHPKCSGLNLGAGLAHYFQWLSNGKNAWLDVDLKPVIELRQSFIPQTSGTCNNQVIDITKPGWWKLLKLSGHHRQPVFVVCEGVLMYLQPRQVDRILREIGDNAPQDSEIVVDFMTPFAVGQSVLAKAVKPMDAPFTWGAYNGQEIAQTHPRLELLSQLSVSQAYGWGAVWAEMFWGPIMGGPLYGLAHLRVSDP